MDNVPRVFVLQTFNGNFLPEGGILFGLIVLFENGTYVTALTYDAPTQPVPDRGTYTISPSGDIVLTGEGNSPSMAGVINDDVLIVTGSGLTSVLTRTTI